MPKLTNPLASSIASFRSHIASSSSGASQPPSPSNSLASAATDATFFSTLKLPSRRGHPVAMSDRQLHRLTSETAQNINWDQLTENAESGAGRWKWSESARDFSIYTRQQSQSFAVMAVGGVPCSVPELVTVLHAVTADQHVSKMDALHGGQFKEGALVYNVDMESAPVQEVTALTATDSMVTEVAVKTATFAKSNWLHRDEEWCYVDGVRRHKDSEVFEKLMVTLSPKDLVAGKSPSRTKFIRGVVGGYLVKPIDNQSDAAAMKLMSSQANSMKLISSHAKPLKMTRVQFFAEFTPEESQSLVSFRRSHASDKAVKDRLVKMAQSCERLTQLIRRRRLGVQILVDKTQFLPPTNIECFCCSKFLVLAKVCRVCGQGVCANCSQKHERETLVRTRHQSYLESVRVCTRCMDRVDKSNYAHLTDKSLFGPVVFPNREGEKPADETLRTLLEDALVSAPSTEKRVSVMNVIKCVLDQSESSSPARTSITLTPTSSVHDYVSALDYLEVTQVDHASAEVSASCGRAYAVDPGNPDEQMAYPVPANEAERLEAIEKSRIQKIGRSEELNIICDLAAKELDSFAGLVTIVTEDEQQVIGSSVESLENARFPRAHAFCSHTIMDNKPFVVPHPEADVRFHQCGPVQELKTRYYCGFPLVAEDNKTVIGALCCIDFKSHDMTESQYSALSKLAQTAAKVVRIQGSQQRPSASVETSKGSTQL